MLFLRKNTEKMSPYEKAGRKITKGVQNFCEAHLVGTVGEGPSSATVSWRIMGMRMRRSEGVSTDYDVHRMLSNVEVGSTHIRERIAMERREGILRLCRYDSESDAKIFRHEFLLLKMLAKTYTTRNHRAHYPCVLGQGCLAELRYLNVGDNSGKHRDIVETPKIPRPYFIVESLEPSVETLFKSNKTTSLPVNTSVYITIGCIKALRLLHMEGFIHRNVQPAYFSLRFPCGGLLGRKESELSDLVAITDLSTCRRYRINLVRGRNCLTYVGNWKYGSIETMTGKDATAIDDIISCIYMLTEFVLGAIPWSAESDKQAIINVKKQVEQWDRVEDGKCTALLMNYRRLYEWLRKQPLLQTIDYEAFYEELLKTAEGTGQIGSGDQSLFGFSNPLNDVYDHGFAEKRSKDGKGKKSVAREKARSKKTAGKMEEENGEKNGGKDKEIKEKETRERTSEKKSTGLGSKSAQTAKKDAQQSAEMSKKGQEPSSLKSSSKKS